MTLRHDVNEYFAREAARYPTQPGLRSSIISEAQRAVVGRLNRQWPVAAVAVLLGFAVIAGLLVAGNLRRTQTVPAAPSPAVTQTPAVSPSPAQLHGPIPAGQPVILYRRRGTIQLIGASWGGVLYAGPDAPIGQGADSQSPDGSKILIGVVVFDLATGARTRLPVELIAGYTGRITWGDDSQHLCLTTQTALGSPVAISIVGLGSTPTNLASLGKLEMQVQGPTVLACSPSTGRVVVADVGGSGEARELWVLSATTGAVQYHRTYPATTKTNGNGFRVVASRDGQYLAENDSTTGSANIRRLSDDSVVAQIVGKEVHAFSWNGDILLATPRQADLLVVNSTFNDPAVIDWRTNRTVWQAPAGARWFAFSLATQPEGSGMALGLNVCAPTGAPCQVDLWLIGSDGKGHRLDRNVELLAWEGF